MWEIIKSLSTSLRARGIISNNDARGKTFKIINSIFLFYSIIFHELDNELDGETEYMGMGRMAFWRELCSPKALGQWLAKGSKGRGGERRPVWGWWRRCGQLPTQPYLVAAYTHLHSRPPCVCRQGVTLGIVTCKPDRYYLEMEVKSPKGIPLEMLVNPKHLHWVGGQRYSNNRNRSVVTGIEMTMLLELAPQKSPQT